jgi:hypothetical protein
MAIREFDRKTIFTQPSNAGPYGKLNCITELQIYLQSVAGFFFGCKGTGGKVDCSSNSRHFFQTCTVFKEHSLTVT